MDYANTPLEGYLARHKRASILSPITSVSLPVKPILDLFGIGNGTVSRIVSTIVDSIQFIVRTVNGQEACPKIEKSSLCELIPAIGINAVLHPIKTARFVTCYVIQRIGAQSRELTGKTFELLSQFFFKVFLPGLHTTLNTLNNTGLLPPQISAAITMFNLIYGVLKISGYVP